MRLTAVAMVSTAFFLGHGRYHCPVVFVKRRTELYQLHVNRYLEFIKIDGVPYPSAGLAGFHLVLEKSSLILA